MTDAPPEVTQADRVLLDTLDYFEWLHVDGRPNPDALTLIARFRTEALAAQSAEIERLNGLTIGLSMSLEKAEAEIGRLKRELAVSLSYAEEHAKARKDLEEALHAAQDLLQHIDWLTCGLPEMLENAALTDEEGLIGAAVDAANSHRTLLSRMKGVE